MAYTYIGREPQARKLGGSPSDGTNGTPEEVTPTELKDALQYGHGQLLLWSTLPDTTVQDTLYPFHAQCQEIEEHFAASYIRSIWRDPDNKAQEYYNRAKQMVTAMLENQPTSQTTSASYTSVAYQYKTNALNANRPRYVSPRTDF
jgi:hypothetical protein